MNVVNNAHPIRQFFSDALDSIVGTFKNIFFPMSYFEGLNLQPRKLQTFSAVQLNCFGPRAFYALNPDLYTQRQVQSLNETKFMELFNSGRIGQVLAKLSDIQAIRVMNLQPDLEPEFIEKVQSRQLLWIVANDENNLQLRSTERISHLFRNLSQRSQKAWESQFLRIQAAFEATRKHPNEVRAVRDLLKTSEVPSVEFIENEGTRDHFLELLKTDNHELKLFGNISLRFYNTMLDKVIINVPDLLHRGRIIGNLNSLAIKSAQLKEDFKALNFQQKFNVFNDPSLLPDFKIKLLEMLAGVISEREMQFYALLISSPEMLDDKFRNLSAFAYFELFAMVSQDVRDNNDQLKIKALLQKYARESAIFNASIKVQTFNRKVSIFSDPKVSMLAKVSFLEVMSESLCEREMQFYALLVSSPEMLEAKFRNLSMEAYFHLFELVNGYVPDRSAQGKMQSVLQSYARRSNGFNEAVKAQTLKDRLKVFNDPKVSTLAKLSFLEVVSATVGERESQFYSMFIDCPLLQNDKFRNLTLAMYFELFALVSEHVQDKDSLGKIKCILQSYAIKSRGLIDAARKQSLKDRINLFNDPKVSSLAKARYLELLGNELKIGHEEDLLLLSFIPLPEIRERIFDKTNIKKLWVYVERVITKEHLEPYRVIPAGSILLQADKMTDESLKFLKDMSTRVIGTLSSKVAELTDAVDFIEKKLEGQAYKDLKVSEKADVDSKVLFLDEGRNNAELQEMIKFLDAIHAVLNKAEELNPPGVVGSIINYVKSYIVTPVEILKQLEQINRDIERFKALLEQLQKETFENLASEEEELDIYQYTGASSIDYTAKGNWKKELGINNMNVFEELEIAEASDFKRKYNAAFPEDLIPVNLSKLKRIEKLKRYLAKFCPPQYRFNSQT